MKTFTKSLQVFIARGGLAIMLALIVVIGAASVKVKAETPTPTPATTLGTDAIQGIFTTPNPNEGEEDVFKDVNTLASGTAKSALNIVRTIGAFVIVGGILIAALKMGTGNPQKRQQAKEELGWKIGAAILFLGGIAVLLFANKLAGSIATALVK